VYGDEENLLKSLNPEWEQPESEEAEKEFSTRIEIDKQDPNAEINDYLYGTTSGGNIRAPNATGKGYIQASNTQATGGAQGGWIAPLLQGLASLLPMLLADGKGMEGNGKHSLPYYPSQPDLSNASNFYRHFVKTCIGQGVNSDELHSAMENLFGGKAMYKKMLSGKIGSGSPQKLLMGHLLQAPLLGHLKKALGKSADVTKIMDLIENSIPEIMDAPVTAKGMCSGGSILGSIWNGLKGVVGKVLPMIKGFFGNKKVQDIASGVANAVGDVALKRAPKIGELATNKLMDYANKKLVGDEPTGRKLRGKKPLKGRKTTARRIPVEVEEDEEPEEEEEEDPPNRRKIRYQTPDD
jgi:hypothetical protein